MRLKMSMKPHRGSLPANADTTKLFVALEMQVDLRDAPVQGTAPSPSEAQPKRASVGVVFLVDTSGSMSHLRLEEAEQDFGPDKPLPAPGESRLDVATNGLHQFVASGSLKPGDRVAIAHFDSEASTLIGFTAPSEREKIDQAIEGLRLCSGGTRMGRGLQHALGLLGHSGMAAERIVLLSDGNTVDADLVRASIGALRNSRVPVICIGFGADWNTELLNELSDHTHGRPYHVAGDAQIGEDSEASRPIGQFARLLDEEFVRAATEMLTGFRAYVSTAQGVRLVRATQVTPGIREAAIADGSFELDNVGTRESSICLLEFDVDGRPPSRARLAQFGLTFRRAINGTTGEIGPRDFTMEFSTDDARTASIDTEVTDLVAARNAYFLGDEAARLSDHDPNAARELLSQVERLSGRLNPALASAVRSAMKRLDSGKALSPASKKTLQVGGKTKSVQPGGLAGLSDEEISEATGS
jgi:Ca-activated chloride channel family protein